MELFKRKKGSLAFDWIYGLTFLFSLALLFIIFNQAMDNHIVPALEDTIPDDYADKATVLATNNEWLSYWNFIPFLLLFMILTYWFVSGIRQGKDNKI